LSQLIDLEEDEDEVLFVASINLDGQAVVKIFILKEVII
jgi:hypothetical protein